MPGNCMALLVFLLSAYSIQAQGIKGKVVDTNGDPLPFASIGVIGTNQGIASNIEGEYMLPLVTRQAQGQFSISGIYPHRYHVS